MNVQNPPAPDLDLNACDREPIHIPGSIQPHGFLVALGPDGRIAAASANTDTFLGVDATALVGRDLADVLPALGGLVGTDFTDLEIGGGARHVRTFSVAAAGGERILDVIAHRTEQAVILECEEVPNGPTVSLDELYPGLRRFVEQLQGAGSVADLCQLAADEVRRITVFDRVLVYRFDPQWNGTVIAESRNEVLPSYLDLRFPASDIPAQARELYRRNRLRIIPDASYRPVPLVPPVAAPLDLSDSVLRSVSPIHLEYMRNMGTMASMSISILREGQLWGLISCHNRDAHRVRLTVRNACDFLTQVFALQVAARERAADADQRVRLGSVRARLLAAMAEEDRFIDGLLHHPAELMNLADAQGAAVVTGDRCWCLGETPGEHTVRALYDWLSQNHREDVFATDALGEILPEAAGYADRASGLLAISISKMHASYVLWFRPEVVQTVKWGGDPTKRVEEGATRLHPRRSFETWKETLRGHSLPWETTIIDAVKELRNAIVGIVLRRAEELASLSDELQRSNKELEAFSYSVSHDLRAPFRHIVGYAELLRKQEGAHLSERGQRYVDTIIDSALTAGTLVDNLLSFSQMGRTTLKPRLVPMAALTQEVRDRMAPDIGERRIDWRIADLPAAYADPMMIRLVLENLLGNAVKYTRNRSTAVIEIGSYRDGGEVVFFVRDNGVGFDMLYVGKLFGVFQRLHRMEEFEGTGIGLANVRRIVERHGGRAWAEGAVDRGATFYFSLPDRGAA